MENYYYTFFDKELKMGIYQDFCNFFLEKGLIGTELSKTIPSQYKHLEPVLIK